MIWLFSKYRNMHAATSRYSTRTTGMADRDPICQMVPESTNTHIHRLVRLGGKRLSICWLWSTVAGDADPASWPRSDFQFDWVQLMWPSRWISLARENNVAATMQNVMCFTYISLHCMVIQLNLLVWLRIHCIKEEKNVIVTFVQWIHFEIITSCSLTSAICMRAKLM